MLTQADIKNLIFHPKTDRAQLLGQIKSSGSIGSFNKLIKIALQHPLTKKFLLGNSLPKEYNQIRENKIIPYSGNFEGEAAWNLFAIQKYSNEVTTFIKLKNEYESLLLLNDFDNAELIIDKIESTICKSLWSLENRFLLAEYKDGTEKNWTLLSDFSKSLSDPFALFFSEQFSKRAESKIPYFRYRNLFSNQIAEINGPPEFIEYLCYRLNYPAYTGYQNYPFFLNIESVSSVIDKYLLLREILVDSLGEKNKEKLIAVREILAGLDPISSDKVLYQIRNLVNPQQFECLGKSEELFQTLDLYTRGEFRECITQIPSLLKRYPSSIELYEIYVKSLIEAGLDFETTNTSSLVDEILLHLYNIYSRNSKNEESVERLLKIILSFFSCDWAKQLYSLLSYQNNINEGIRTNKLFYIVYSQFDNPRILNFLSSRTDYFHHVFNKINSLYQDNKALRLSVLINTGDTESIKSDEELSRARRNLYVGRALIKEQKFEEAISYYEKLIITQELSVTAYEELINVLFKTYLKLQKHREAVILFVDNYIKNKSLVTKFQKELLLNIIEKSGCNGLEDIIELPIFYKIVSLDPYSQYVSYDIFISSYNAERPKQIFGLNDRFGSAKFIFFLRDVCTADILHHSYLFEGSEDIENERIEILRELLRIDKENEGIYIKEITEISQAAAIRKAIREVNKGRITVNIPQLKSIESSNIKEGFNRYQELANYSKNKDLIGIESSSKLITEYLKALNEDRQHKMSSQTKDPAYISFKVMFFELRDKFILSKEYGLDGYLSTRIRHGTLLNHIRSVFESLNLISKKDKDDKYHNIDYWVEKTPYNLHHKSEAIQNSLRKFSKRIDDLTESILRELIQVYTEKHTSKPRAIFNYAFTQEFLWIVFNYVKDNIKDYDKFLDYVFQELEEVTEINLQKARKLFEGDIKNSYLNIIDELHTEVKQIIQDVPFVDLTSSIIKCITNIQNELRNISEWFNLSNPSSDPALDLKTLLQTTVEITNAIYPNNRLSPVINADSSLAFYGGIHLIYIVRIFLDNMILHSYLSSDELQVEIKAELVDNTLLLTFSNNISPDVNESDLEQTLSSTKQKWKEDKSDFEKINVEGGSGFDKIRRILLFDLGCKNYYFDYSIVANKVSITIGLDVKIRDYETT